VNEDDIVEATKSRWVYLDTYVPVTTLNANPGYSVNPYYIQNTSSLTFGRSESGSGIAYTRYRIDDGEWQTYSSAFNLAGYSEGSYTIYYYSVDNIGHRESNKSRTLIVDDSDPYTTISRSGYYSGEYVSGDTTFTLTRTDNSSGVWYTRYRIDGGSWYNYYNPFSLSGYGSPAVSR